MPIPRQELNQICQKGMQLLNIEKYYPKTIVWQKLQILGFAINRTSALKILSGKGLNTKQLPVAAEGIKRLIWEELGMEWKEDNFIKTADQLFVPKITETSKKQGYNIHTDGRLPTALKASFFKDAQKEVIELGLTLSRFSNNLSSATRSEFRVFVEELLCRGVNFKCYLLNPIGNFARIYFTDRGSTHQEELRYERKMEDAIAKLQVAYDEISQHNFAGKFEVFTYEHFPYGYYMAVDGATSNCKMLVSSYLLGIKRGNTPVLEFSRESCPDLYHIYWPSLEALTKNAKRIIPA